MSATPFWSRLRQARLPRILLVYLAASWLILQLTSLLREELQLPHWITPIAIVLLLIGMVIISATAWVQSHPMTGVRARTEEIPSTWEIDLGEMRESVARGRFPHLTWARAILGGILAFALLFGLAGLYVLLQDRGHSNSGEARSMLAVLPFENLGAPEDEYFADGLTEEITAHLARMRGLGVISRTTAMRYKATEKPVKQIGSELGVAYVLEGTVRWQKSPGSQDRVRITPQLIRVADDTHVWADVYDEVLAEVFQIQSDIAEQVTSSLGIALLEPERRSLETKPTKNLEAYDYYLRGNDYYNRSKAKEDLRIAEQMFQQAIELDPAFALAHARLSQVHMLTYWYYYDRSDERLAMAKGAVDRALQLEPNLAEAHIALGFYHYWGSLDYAGALEQFAIAQQNRPNDSDLLFAIAAVQRRRGDFEEAILNFSRALELDPRSQINAFEVGATHYWMRNYEQAERYLDRAITLAPDYASPHVFKVRLYWSWDGSLEKSRQAARAATRQFGLPEVLPKLFSEDLLDFYPFELLLSILDEEAIEALDHSTLEAFDGDSLHYFLSKATLHGLRGRPESERAYYDSTRALLENMIRGRPGEGRYHTLLGIAYASLGRKEDAIREGRRGVELRPPSRDAMAGPILVQDLAQIYAMVGEQELAIDQLELLLSIPGRMSIPWIRVDPSWDPLRGYPRFTKLLKGRSQDR